MWHLHTTANYLAMKKHTYYMDESQSSWINISAPPPHSLYDSIHRKFQKT